MLGCRSIAAGLLFLVCGACAASPKSDWANFSAPTISGGEFVLLSQKHFPVLLAFLAMTGDEDHGQSRSEAVVLQSMDHQYGKRGIRIVAMDVSAEVSRRIVRHDDAVNAVADWNLTFPILEDATDHSMRQFHIRSLPAIVLISSSGRELGRWQGYTRTPILAQAIERTLGGPLAALPEIPSSPENKYNLR